MFKYLLIGLYISCPVVWGQKTAEVKKLEQARLSTLKEIELTDRLLQQTDSSARTSLYRLSLLSQQIHSRKKVISLLNQEIESVEQETVRQQDTINRLEQDLERRKESYGKTISSMYRRQSSLDKLIFILSADNFARSYRRMRYLKEFADWQKQQVLTIKERKLIIEEKRVALVQSLKEKQKLLHQKEGEKQKLQQEEAGSRAEVHSLNKQREKLKKTLLKKRKQAQILDQQIEKLIAEETARSKAAEHNQPQETTNANHRKQPNGYVMTMTERRLSNDFEKNKGKLPSPVSAPYVVVAAFGEQPHRELKYVRTNNNGIDIQTESGASARTVFNGVVTRVFVIPGFNSSVIIRHGNYLTVYCNLSQVYVKAGDHVTTGQTLGSIFCDKEAGNSTILHFQLWKEKEKLNPETWLR